MSRRSIHLIDLAVAVWAALWIALGVVGCVEVHGLTGLSDTMQVSGESLQQAGDALAAVASVPLVGSGIQAAADRVQTLASKAIGEAQSSRTHIVRLSVLAVCMSVLPILMVVAVWMPLRRVLGRAR